ncbi:MAG: DUF460 domain-containing protein [Candidatus Micrarchaeaceae archaeon]
MHIIVGIDPGDTVGISCIGLNGDLLYSIHGSGKGFSWIVKVIISVGTPSIIATDKHKIGALVKKIGAAFNTNLFSPDSDIGLEEKKALARKAGIKNPHERDAFAAAMCAFNEYRNKLRQAERVALSKNYSNIDEIKSKVLDKFSIDEALHNKPSHRR